MTEIDACEQAYKNGYAAGRKDCAKRNKIKKYNKILYVEDGSIEDVSELEEAIPDDTKIIIYKTGYCVPEERSTFAKELSEKEGEQTYKIAFNNLRNYIMTKSNPGIIFVEETNELFNELIDVRFDYPTYRKLVLLEGNDTDK